MHGFIYEWTNTSNGLKYIGKHEGTPNDGYIGSGPAFRNSYNKHPELFVRKILWESNNTTAAELIEKEESILQSIPDNELFYGTNRKYYNQVRNSAGYTSADNPMKNPETVARMMSTRAAKGITSNPHILTIKKYGEEGARKIRSESKKGNTFGKGNKGSAKAADHKSKIAESVNAMYKQKKANGVQILSTGGRPRALDYSIIIATVKQLGFKDAAKELNLSVAALKGRYYNAVKYIK